MRNTGSGGREKSGWVHGAKRDRPANLIILGCPACVQGAVELRGCVDASVQRQLAQHMHELINVIAVPVLVLRLRKSKCEDWSDFVRTCFVSAVRHDAHILRLFRVSMCLGMYGTVCMCSMCVCHTFLLSQSLSYFAARCASGSAQSALWRLASLHSVVSGLCLSRAL